MDAQIENSSNYCGYCSCCENQVSNDKLLVLINCIYCTICTGCFDSNDNETIEEITSVIDSCPSARPPCVRDYMRSDVVIPFKHISYINDSEYGNGKTYNWLIQSRPMSHNIQWFMNELTQLVMFYATPDASLACKVMESLSSGLLIAKKINPSEFIKHLVEAPICNVEDVYVITEPGKTHLQHLPTIPGSFSLQLIALKSIDDCCPSLWLCIDHVHECNIKVVRKIKAELKDLDDLCRSWVASRITPSEFTNFSDNGTPNDKMRQSVSFEEYLFNKYLLTDEIFEAKEDYDGNMEIYIAM